MSLVTVNTIMLTFREYIALKEASYNPFQSVGTGSDAADIAGTLGYLPAGLAASPYAAYKGLQQAAGTYRSMRHGNPYLSDSPQNTKVVAGKAFKESSDWLLNFVANEKLPKAKQGYIQFLATKLGEVEKEMQQAQPKRPSVLGGVFALPVSVFSGVRAAAKNVIDTLNPEYRAPTTTKLWMDNIEKMVLALDALRTVVPWDLIDAYIKTFLHNLEKGWGSGARKIGLS